MALSDVLLSPLGLIAVLAAVPIVILYLIRPEPERVEIPTFRFLVAEERQRSTTPLLERLSRSLLLLIQLLAILLLATSLATPYVPVSERATVEETVLVVDTSASMATADGGESRFDRAIETARDETTSATSVVTTDDGGQVLIQRGTPNEAGGVLDDLESTDAPGDLRGAISQASALAGDNARIVVLSDFAGEAWTDAVTTARGRDISVDLRQFASGGEDNVGFIDRRFSGSEVTLSVRNFGESTVSRTVQLGGQTQELSLDGGDTATVTFPVPAGRSQARLSPADDFAVDDSVSLAAPEDPTVDVLVLTNDRNQYLTTALSVVDTVELTVENPPTTIDDDYDVIIYSNINSESLLPGNVESGRELLADGGGVAIQAQENLPERYGDLLLLEPSGVHSGSSVRTTGQSELTRGIDFQQPDEYISGSLREGQSLVEFRDGSPLIATAERGPGRLLYYGYIEDSSSFKFNYQYPVFWKRAAFQLAGREPLSALNYATGQTARFQTTTVSGPDGSVSGSAVTLRLAGFYGTDNRQVSASLLDEAESDTVAEPLEARPGTVGDFTREEQRTVPRPLTEFLALGALVVLLLEVGYLYRRGDL
jgi:hypothetical protein